MSLVDWAKSDLSPSTRDKLRELSRICERFAAADPSEAEPIEEVHSEALALKALVLAMDEGQPFDQAEALRLAISLRCSCILGGDRLQAATLAAFPGATTGGDNR